MKKIIFMGTPEFSATVLRGIIQSEYKVIAVVTQPDRPVGRKKTLTAPPVKKIAVEHDIPVFQPEKLSGSPEMETLLSLDADLIITAAYGQFVPTKLLKFPSFKAINVHASLLPKYRGGAPIHYAIWNGESETGISIMYMEREMDAGDILAQAITPIGPDEDVADLFERLALIGRDLLLETLPKLFTNKIVPVKQDEKMVSYSPTITKEQEQINWSQNAKQIHHHVRAFCPFPSTFTILNGERIKIWKGSPIEFSMENNNPFGTIVAVEADKLVVQCNQSYYGITELQPSGKKRMDVVTYLNGIKEAELIGQQFEVRNELVDEN